MELFLKTLGLQLVMFTYIACGFIAYKLKIITDQGRQTLIELTMDILMPVMIFKSFTGIDKAVLFKALPILLMAIVVCAFSWLIGRYAYPKTSRDKQSVLHYDTLVGNVSFAGIPLAQALFAETGVIYSSVYTLVTRVIMWTVGLSLFGGEKGSVKATLKKLIKNPCIVSTLLGHVACIVSLPLPGFIDSSFAGISACVAPISMIIVGSVMASIELNELYDSYMLRYCLVRLVIIPVTALRISTLLGLDAVQRGTILLLSAMPAPSTSAILAGKYGGNLRYASKLLFVSNILSIVTVPALMLIL